VATECHSMVTELASTGALRDAVFLASQTASLLAWSQAWTASAPLLGWLRNHQESHWPVSWRRGIQRIARLHAIGKGVQNDLVQSFPTRPEDLEARLMDAAIGALETGNHDALTEAVDAMESAQRPLLAKLIAGLGRSATIPQP
jgi:hypothetical protein